MLEEIEGWLEKHFDREETVLLPAVKKHGDEKLVTPLTPGFLSIPTSATGWPIPENVLTSC